MKKTIKLNKKGVHETGIALIFSLVMLALLLVMALSFATNSMFSQKISNNNANGASARILAQATAQRIVGIMNNYYSVKGYNLEYYTSFAGSVADEDMRDSLIPKTEGYSSVFRWTSTSDSKIDWEYMHSDGKLIGRVAYLAVKNGVNPAACVKSGEDEGTYPEKRFGADVNEVNLQSLNTSYITSALATQLSYSIDSGKLSVDGNWLDFANMFYQIDNVAPVLIPALSVIQKDILVRYFMIDAPEDEELFWIDDNCDGLVDTTSSNNERFNRFNIGTRANSAAVPLETDWDNMTVGKLLGNAKEAGSLSPNNGGIPWLAHFGQYWDAATLTFKDSSSSSLKANFPDVTMRRNQIAANLIDYCDSDSTPTSDISPGSWNTSTPTYTGNEKTAYLNEFTVEANYTVNHTTPGPGMHSYAVVIKLECVAEIVNMYSLPNATYQVRVIGSADTGTGWNTFDTSFNLSMAGSYSIQDNILVTRSFTSGPSATASVTIPALALRLDRIILIDPSGNNVDLALFNNAQFDFSVQAESGNANLYRCRDLVVKDPRQNLNAITDDLDWNYRLADFPLGTDTVARATAQTNAKTSLGSNNTDGGAINYSPSSWKGAHMLYADAEPSTEQSSVSTAYIRNAPMKSPWELGCIHRAATYQTIRLSKFDPRFATTYKNLGTAVDSAPVGEYDKGDANILDQIKMNDNITNPTKIDIRPPSAASANPNLSAITALLHKIQLGSGYDDPSASGTDVANIGIPQNPPYDMPSKIRAENFTTPFQTRAQVANVPELTNGAIMGTQNTDALQEEVIGKFINLTKVGGMYTVVIVAQSIKDVGTAAGITVNKRATDGTIKPINATLGTLDMVPDSVAGKYLYADEITSEQKIVVRIIQDPLSGKIKILDMKYLY